LGIHLTTSKKFEWSEFVSSESILPTTRSKDAGGQGLRTMVLLSGWDDGCQPLVLPPSLLRKTAQRQVGFGDYTLEKKQ